MGKIARLYGLRIMNFEKFLHEAAGWVREHQEQAWGIAGGTLLFALLITLVIRHHETELNEAWIELGGVQTREMQGKLEEARKAMDTWESHFQGTEAATYATFIKADLLYRTSDYAQAAQVYGEIVQTGRPDLLRPLALYAQISSEEMAGHIPQALKLAQAFLDRYPDHFLSGPAYLTQARLLEYSGDAAAAAAVYDRYLLLFPQSPWTDFARARTRTLSAAPRALPAGRQAAPQPRPM